MAWPAARPAVRALLAGSAHPEQAGASVRAAEWQPIAEGLRAVEAPLGGA